jgi:single-strand DNA-binding protein
MQIITVSGNLGRDPELRTTQGGDDVLSFSVGVQQGWGERASTNWFRCSVWGKRAKTLADKLRKGSRVFVVGELTIGEYQSKPQYEIRVSELDFSKAAGGEQRSEPQGGGGNSGWTGDDDLDDGVPFARWDDPKGRQVI